MDTGQAHPCFQQFYHIYLAAYIGAKIVILSKFTLDTFLSAIERYRVTVRRCWLLWLTGTDGETRRATSCRRLQ
jgi:hypothetical protein